MASSFLPGLFFGVVFSGAAIALLLAFGQLLIRDRRSGNLLLFGIYGSIALIELQASLFALAPELRAAFPHLARFGPLYLLLPGPLLLAFIRDVLLARSLPYRLWHLALPAVVGLAMAPFAVLDFLRYSARLQCTEFCAQASALYFQFTYWLNPGANLVLLAYLAAVVWHLQRRPVDLISGRRAVQAMTLVLGLAVAAVLCNLAGFVTKALVLDGAGAVLLSGIMYVVLLLAHRYPEMLYVMRALRGYDTENAPSPLRDLDLKALYGELRRLMEEERFYCDEDLHQERWLPNWVCAEPS